MLNYSCITKLTPDDVLIFGDLVPLAEKAQKLEKQIKETYLFHIGEEKIELCSNHEYLTHDGLWQTRYTQEHSYDIACTAEEIFDYLKAHYLIENGLVEKFEGKDYTKEGAMEIIFPYFNSFLNRTVEMYEKKHNDE